MRIWREINFPSKMLCEQIWLFLWADLKAFINKPHFLFCSLFLTLLWAYVHKVTKDNADL